jgi:hypothetical protein
MVVSHPGAPPRHSQIAGQAFHGSRRGGRVHEDAPDGVGTWGASNQGLTGDPKDVIL